MALYNEIAGVSGYLLGLIGLMYNSEGEYTIQNQELIGWYIAILVAGVVFINILKMLSQIPYRKLCLSVFKIIQKVTKQNKLISKLKI
jgi:hypothetical protein